MRARLAATAVAAGLTLAACGGGGEGVDIGGEGGGGGKGGGTLVAAISGEPDQLDPHKTSAYPSFQVLENVYDTLVQPNEKLEMEPALAESWKTSKDGRTWTFALRDGVKFHNGNAFTADDVVYSYRRIIDEKLANAYRFEAVKGIKAQGDDTVVITLSRAAPNLLEMIGAFKGMAILDKDSAKTDLRREANGTGPFKLESYRAGDSVELVSNGGYWGGAPKLEGVTFRFLPEAATALTNLQSGDVHWTDNVPPQQISSLKGNADVQIGQVPSNDYWYFAANQARKPFNDVRVRQALAYAIDRESITEAAKFGAATANQTAIPESSTYYHDYAPYRHDPAKAKELLQQAGVGSLTVDLMVTNEFPETVQAAQVMSSQFKEVGITTKIRTLDFAAWLDEQGKGNFDVFMLGWLGNIDPDDFYYAQHRTGANFNFQKYSNPQVDRLLDQARRETDEGKRKQLYDQAVKQIVDDASYVYLYNPDVVQAWRKDVQGYQARPDRAIRFHNATVAG
ncbi:MAG: ABC transporter substrate-binding protein [Actinomycetota bacterium]|nr:ABC transporter substrate-binding protein [Actinomycetota bacterium]